MTLSIYKEVMNKSLRIFTYFFSGTSNGGGDITKPNPSPPGPQSNPGGGAATIIVLAGGVGLGWLLVRSCNSEPKHSPKKHKRYREIQYKNEPRSRLLQQVPHGKLAPLGHITSIIYLLPYPNQECINT